MSAPPGMPSQGYVSPFARHGNWTVFDNALVDTLLPHLSPSAWAVLSVILRQTQGWQREDAEASQKNLADATGMTPSTVATALGQLLDPATFPPSVVDQRCGGVLLSNAETRSRREPTTYRLNPAFRLRASAVRRFGDADDPASHYQVRVQAAPGVIEGAGGASTSIFEVLSTAIFGARYKDRVKAIPSGGKGASRQRSSGDEAIAFSSLGAAADAIAAGVDALSPSGQVHAILATARALYDPRTVPLDREGSKDAGALRNNVRGGGRAVRLLIQYALEGVTGNPLRYVMAAQSGRERDGKEARASGRAGRVAGAGPEVGAVYLVDVVKAFVDAGVPRSEFVGAGTDTAGNRKYRYHPAAPEAHAAEQP